MGFSLLPPLLIASRAHSPIWVFLQTAAESSIRPVFGFHFTGAFGKLFLQIHLFPYRLIAILPFLCPPPLHFKSPDAKLK